MPGEKMVYKLDFNLRRCEDLSVLYGVNSCCWVVDTFSSEEKRLVNGWCRDAICELQFILRYFDKHKKKNVELVSKVYNMVEPDEEPSFSPNWNKLNKEVNKMIVKCLKATNKNSKDNFDNLRSVLWNKMREELVKRVRERVMENENDSKEFFERKNFTPEIYYPADGRNDTHRSLIMRLEGKLNFRTDEYTLRVTYLINPKHDWSLYENLFVSLCDVNAIDWYLEGPGKSKIDNDKFFTASGVTTASLEDVLLKIIWRTYWTSSLQQKESWASDIISELNDFAMDVFYDWRKREKCRLNPEKKIHQRGQGKLIDEVGGEPCDYVLSFNYAFEEPFMTSDSTIWGTAIVNVDFLKEKVEEAAKYWFDISLKIHDAKDVDIAKDQFGEYLLDNIYGTLTYRCSTPSNPNFIDCKIEKMGKGDFRIEIGKRFCKMSQHNIFESLKSELVKKFWSVDYRLPKDTRKVLNELGATSLQKSKVADEFERLLETNPFCQVAVNKVADKEIPGDDFTKFDESYKIDLALENLNLIDFNVQKFHHLDDMHPWPNIYEITFKKYISESNSEYFTIQILLHMKNSRVVSCYSINVKDHFKALSGEMKCEQFINKTTYNCSEENKGSFVKEAVHFMGTEIEAKALKKKILNEIRKGFFKDIIWTC